MDKVEEVADQIKKIWDESVEAGIDPIANIGRISHYAGFAVDDLLKEFLDKIVSKIPSEEGRLAAMEELLGREIFE